MRVFLGRVRRYLDRGGSRRWIARCVVDGAITMVKCGTTKEAWWAPADIAPGAIVYCGGVGRDATYDFCLAEEKGLEVHSFDPTPMAIAYMAGENRGRVAFHPWGMMGQDRIVRFHAPVDIEHTSWFAENLHGTSEFFEAECLTMKSIMARLGHAHVDLLKIDIEGSWHSVLLNMLADQVYPTTVCVEFDSPAPLARVRKVTLALENAYRAVLQEGDNVAFYRSSTA
jgi:FkbM family methyltransferase